MNKNRTELIMIGLGFAIFLTVSIGQGFAVESLSTIYVDNSTIDTIGSTTKINITIDKVPDGLSGYNLNISLSNTNIAEIMSVTFPAWATLHENSVLPADSVWIKAVDLTDQVKSGDMNILLGTLTLRGDHQGLCDIIATITKMDDDDGYPIDALSEHGRLEVDNREQDSDGDGVVDELDNCSDTTSGAIVDLDGCSCAQKTCDDQNPCTDDACDPETAECIYTIDDTNTCGELRDCPEDHCDTNPPYENWLDYTNDGHDYCSDGLCITYNCTLKTSIYNETCDPDDDNDGVPDESDNCSNTLEGAIVDPSGCSCAQKTCDDQNPCTDNACDPETAECIYTNDDTNTCGEARDCPQDHCDAEDPYENWLDYPDDGHDYCSSGSCVVYPCEIISSMYNKTCDPDDDNDGDPDITDCEPENPDVYNGAQELCDGVDNDCDGLTDEDFTNLGDVCNVGVGECERTGEYICSADKLSTECNAVAGNPSEELCDGLDNDCDSQTDEDFTNLGNVCIIGVGECERTGNYVCTADKTGTECNAVAGEPTYELCDGFDNDCDGLIDEIFTNLGDSCTVGIGECKRTGEYVCTADELGTECNAVPGEPVPEICDDGLDNDCDGYIDAEDIEDCCTPIWILNESWSKCAANVKSKNFYDANNCNDAKTKPADIRRYCALGIGVYRDLPESANIGDEFTVTLTIDINELNKPKVYILYETIPEGFDVIDTGAMQYTPSTQTLRLMVFESAYYGTRIEDRIIKYTLKYKTQHSELFEGRVEYDKKSHIILGDNNITGTIEDCIPNWILNDTWSECVDGTQYRNYYDANDCGKPEEKPPDVVQSCKLHVPPIEVYRALPQSASMGEEFTVTLTVDVNEYNKPTVYILYETIPEGFDVINSGGMHYTASTRTLKLMVFESAYHGTRVEDRAIRYRLRPNAYPTDVFNGYVRYNWKKDYILGDDWVSVSPPS